MTTFDFYSINDLHGKFADGENHPGVDELTTYFQNARMTDDNVVILSAGDMWQGSSESNMTYGMLMTDWMNQIGVTAMAMGNHEFDWGEKYIEDNQEFADFPFLAINIYERATNTLVDYCQPSVIVEGDGIQIGIIGAIGDCYSSISPDKVADIYFKTGSELTSLVKKESNRLRSEGVDFIVYVLHDGHGQSSGSTSTSVSPGQMKSYYDIALSDGYVDLVFEAHTHQQYLIMDQNGVYHLQNRGDNKGGIAHVEVAFNTVTGSRNINVSELVSTDSYASMTDDPIVNDLLEKYKDQIAPANQVLGRNSRRRRSNELRQLAAELYYQVGLEEWSDEYEITLGGGFLQTRSPYDLYAGEVKYSHLQSLFPFDNDLVLCSVKGKDLLNKFINADNSNYFISGDPALMNSVDPNGTYYIVVDTYTSSYAPNRLTVVEKYTPGIYARDLLADYIRQGGME
jgi:2',3'-cyclic-nucleotide 2'-phosphodiesterase/3'-nucleotidase